MKISVEFDDKSYALDVPPALASEATDFFEKIDADMDCGWQMSRWWVPYPDLTQRCQIVADKLLTAIQKNNTEAALLMCAYILHKKPATKRIRINTDGEIQGNEFLDD
ncbi:MAG: hypothetical protein OEU50_18725 [Gammaproteobacteria bacterium]|nr:hypothetical protein [Gammaproteobacteria bacterium]